MKIEKINDKQIRCTISRADLKERKIKLSELAYGTGNSAALFKDMIRQAADDFGFEVDDIPLMVEAIPVSPESLVLILTKVDNPQEMDKHISDIEKDGYMSIPDGIEDFEAGLFGLEEEEDSDGTAEAKDGKESGGRLMFCVYSFDNLSVLMKVSRHLHPVYQGDSALYKSPADGRYYLSLCTDCMDKDRVKYITGILSEYGRNEHAVYDSEFFMIEHYTCLIENDALDMLASL